MIDERLTIIAYASAGLFGLAVVMSIIAGFSVPVAIAWNLLLALDIEYFKVPISVASSPLIIIANVLDVIVFTLLAVWLAAVFFDFIKGLGLRERFVASRIKRMRNQIILTPMNGFSDTLARKLISKGFKLVFIVENPVELDKAADIGAMGIIGNPNLQEVLVKAGIQNASYLIAYSDDDIKNSMVAIAAKSAAKSIQVITRVAHEDNIPKLSRSGIYKCVLPEVTAGTSIAEKIVNFYS